MLNIPTFQDMNEDTDASLASLNVDICDTLRHLIHRESLKKCPKVPARDAQQQVFNKAGGVISGGSCSLNDLKRQFPSCTCSSPAVFHPQDGTGNCNFGATKADRTVWCYIDPNTNCPDSRRSSFLQGRSWSRFACIT